MPLEVGSAPVLQISETLIARNFLDWLSVKFKTHKVFNKKSSYYVVCYVDNIES